MTGRRGSALQTVEHCAHIKSLFHRLEDLAVESVACLLLIELGVTDLNVP